MYFSAYVKAGETAEWMFCSNPNHPDASHWRGYRVSLTAPPGKLGEKSTLSLKWGGCTDVQGHHCVESPSTPITVWGDTFHVEVKAQVVFDTKASQATIKLCPVVTSVDTGLRVDKNPGKLHFPTQEYSSGWVTFLGSTPTTHFFLDQVVIANDRLFCE